MATAIRFLSYNSLEKKKERKKKVIYTKYGYVWIFLNARTYWLINILVFNYKLPLEIKKDK